MHTNCVHDVHTINNFAKYNVLAIEPAGDDSADELPNSEPMR